MSAPGDPDSTTERPALDPEIASMLDRQTWTTDRRLMAQLINSVNTLISLTGKWEKGKEPKFPVIGPVEWRDQQSQAGAAGGNHSVDATLHRLFGA